VTRFCSPSSRSQAAKHAQSPDRRARAEDGDQRPQENRASTSWRNSSDAASSPARTTTTSGETLGTPGADLILSRRGGGFATAETIFNGWADLPRVDASSSVPGDWPSSKRASGIPGSTRSSTLSGRGEWTCRRCHRRRKMSRRCGGACQAAASYAHAVVSCSVRVASWSEG
jgi:hypothetical protein